jgi:hypothetical protein
MKQTELALKIVFWMLNFGFLAPKDLYKTQFCLWRIRGSFGYAANIDLKIKA